MSGLTWLHLSDWHHEYFGTDRKVVRDRLVKDIEERTAISSNLDKIDFIVFSGDAASSGLAEEYNEAKKEFFDRILKASGDVSPRRLFIVPGNHDLYENEIRKLPDDFQKNAVSKEDIDNWLPDATKRDILLRPFRNYTGQDSPDFSNVRTWKIEGKLVSLLGINSAWWCRRHRDVAGEQNDYGFVMVGEPQIHVPLDRISQSDLRIAVLHHSQDWLEYFDGNKIWSRLRQECDFILHGHGHEPKVTAEHGTSGDCVIIPAGASFKRRVAKDPSHINSYNFVHLDFATGKGTVFLRRWIDGRTEWARDDQTHPEGEFSFNLPGHVIEPPGPSVSSSVPHQIRPSPRDFIGRNDELQTLLDGFESGATITGLRGMGGVGKTALALVLAEKLADRYPDGQILVDMEGTDTNPLTTTEAMAQIIRAYDPKFKTPMKESELKGKYFSILYGKRALLLLDNAASREQVEPLLPPPGSALLITSRNKFALPGLKEKDLDILPLEDARNLLLEIAKRIGDQAGELAKLCGCLPLALRNAAYALKEMPNLSVSNYTTRLGDARKRLVLVDASFDLSYQLLAEEMKGLWCMLSVFTADFDLAGAAAVWEMEQAPAEDALGELVKWSLVDFLPHAKNEGGRYRLHDLAHDFADLRLEAAARGPASLRHARHYRKLLLVANQLFLQGNDSLAMGLKLFDINWMDIKAGQKWASENNSKSNEIAEICCSFSGAGNVLGLRLSPLENIKWIEDALASARQINNRDAEESLLGNLGPAYFHLGEPQKAIEYTKLALKISREIGNHWGEGMHLDNLGLAYFYLGNPHKAIKCYKLALKISREIGNQRGEGNCLGNLGIAYSHLGNPHKAIECYELAIKIARQIGDKWGEGNHLGNLGLAYSDLGEPRRAIEYYELALKIAGEIGDRRGEGNHLDNLGTSYLDLSEFRKAIEYSELALKISREISDSRGEGNRLGNLGLAHYRLGETQKAIEYYDQALKISRDVGDRSGEGNRLGNLGLAYSDLGETRKAIEYYDQALKISREICDLKSEGNHIFNKGCLLYRLKQNAEAIGLAKKALTIFEQIESPHAEIVRKALAEWKS